MKMKKVFLLLALFLFLGILALPFVQVPEESQFLRETKITYMCYFAVKKIAIALLEYAEKEGNGLFLPPSLDTLVKHKYIEDQNIFLCGKQKIPYHYFPHLRLDMPGNIPLLIEQNTPHTNSKGEKGGFCLLLNFSILYPLRPGDDIFLIEDTTSALKIVGEQNPQTLQKLLSNPFQSERIKSMCLWRWRQLDAGVSRLGTDSLQSRSLEVSLQTAYTLWPWNPNQAFPILFAALEHNNYFIRKRSWKTIFPNSPRLDFISPTRAPLIAQTLTNKKD